MNRNSFGSPINLGSHTWYLIKRDYPIHPFMIRSLFFTPTHIYHLHSTSIFTTIGQMRACLIDPKIKSANQKQATHSSCSFVGRILSKASRRRFHILRSVIKIAWVLAVQALFYFKWSENRVIFNPLFWRSPILIRPAHLLPNLGIILCQYGLYNIYV